MITKEDLRELDFLNQEIKYLQDKIDNYKPAEIVVDSVKGSSAAFPFTEHTIKIEGLEQKKDNYTEYWSKLREFKDKLQHEILRVEQEIEKVKSSEIRQIIRLHYIDRLNYVQIMFKMGYNAPETPRMKLERFFKNNFYDFE